MSVEIHVLPLNGPLPSIRWKWDAETDILSGAFAVDAPGPGYTGTVELDDEDGSIIVVDIRGGTICGLDIVICPDITVLPGLAVSAEARNGQVIVPSRSPQRDVTAIEFDTTLAIVANPEEETWHLRIGTRRPVEPIRIADRFVIELDATQRLAGFWLEGVPPMPDPDLIRMADSAGPLHGWVVATEERPSTPHQFHFGTDTGAVLGIGSIVRVDGEDRVVFGVVTDAVAYATLVSTADIGGTFDSPGVRHTDVRYWTAAVLRQIPEEPMQPVPVNGTITAASDADVALALRMDSYQHGDDSTGIPVGVYAAGGRSAPIWLDAEFLLGPEAAHLNISGVSGLATKTSAITFLLSSLFQTFPKGKGTVAAVCFNVKGPDLCFLDQPAVLGEADLALWHRLGLRAVPFDDFTVYAPYKQDGVNLNTLRNHPDLAGAVQPLVWGLREVLDFAEVLLNRDDLDAKADAFIDFLADRVIGKRFEAPELGDDAFAVESFADLEQFFRAIFDHLENKRGGAEVWRTHHAATIRKIRNRLGNIAVRSRGLVTDDGEASDLPWGKFRDRSVSVIDLAGVDPLAQDLVFARVIAKLREHLERRDLGVDHLVVFVDELNKYAPFDGPESYVRQMLVDLSERGRYLGLVLFSAQQFRSQVLRRVTGNAGTAIYGRMDPEELALPGYATMTASVKAKLAGLPKGELLLRHPHFTHPVFVRFPRPASLSGREGVERFPPAADMPFADAVIHRLRQLQPALRGDAVRAAIEGRPEDEVRRALSATLRNRPDDVLAFFRGCLRAVISSSPMAPRRGVTPLAHAEDDPFAPY